MIAVQEREEGEEAEAVYFSLLISLSVFISLFAFFSLTIQRESEENNANEARLKRSRV